MRQSRESCRCACPTLSQLHLGKQAGTGAQSTFEGDGRPPEPHLWRPLASRMSHEEGGRTPRRHTHIYSPLGHLATPCRTKVRFSLCTPRDRLLVKVPRRALRACGPPLRVAVIRFLASKAARGTRHTNTLWGDNGENKMTGGEKCDQRGLTGHAQEPG